MYVRRFSTLGVAPAVAAPSAGEAIIRGIAALWPAIFGRSSFPQKKAQIDTWVRQISCDPTLSTPFLRQQWLLLRCGAGDNSVYAPAIANGYNNGTQPFCGFETAHGSRQYAAEAMRGLIERFPSLSYEPNADPNLVTSFTNGGRDPERPGDVPCGMVDTSGGGGYYPTPGGTVSVGATMPTLVAVGIAAGLLYAATHRRAA